MQKFEKSNKFFNGNLAIKVCFDAMTCQIHKGFQISGIGFARIRSSELWLGVKNLLMNASWSAVVNVWNFLYDAICLRTNSPALVNTFLSHPTASSCPNLKSIGCCRSCKAKHKQEWINNWSWKMPPRSLTELKIWAKAVVRTPGAIVSYIRVSGL